jgi:hypothetical protein
MHELHRNVLGVGGGRTVPESQEPAARQKAAGHLVACLGEARSFRSEKVLEDTVASEQIFPAPGDEHIRVHLSHR